MAAILASSPPARGGAGVAQHVAKTGRIIAAATDPADMRRRIGAAALELDAVVPADAAARRRATVAARLPSQAWPDRDLRIVAVDAHTGEPVVFTRDSGVALADAVTASCAGPSLPPHTVGGRRYVDGGYRANENADLAAGCERVLVLSPFGGRTRAPLAWGTDLAAQVAQLRAGGSRVATIFPDVHSRNAFGDKVMDPSTRPPAARAGHEQGKVEAARLAEFWR